MLRGASLFQVLSIGLSAAARVLGIGLSEVLCMGLDEAAGVRYRLRRMKNADLARQSTNCAPRCFAVSGVRYTLVRHRRGARLFPERQGQNLAWTVFHVPCSLCAAVPRRARIQGL